MLQSDDAKIFWGICTPGSTHLIVLEPIMVKYLTLYRLLVNGMSTQNNSEWH